RGLPLRAARRHAEGPDGPHHRIQGSGRDRQDRGEARRRDAEARHQGRGPRRSGHAGRRGEGARRAAAERGRGGTAPRAAPGAGDTAPTDVERTGRASRAARGCAREASGRRRGVAASRTGISGKEPAMEVTREQVKDFLKNMSLMDAAALVKELEQELGVSAAAPVAVAAAGAAPAGGGAAEAAVEKDEFTVVLTSGGAQKIQVIKAVRQPTGPRLQDA